MNAFQIERMAFEFATAAPVDVPVSSDLGPILYVDDDPMMRRLAQMILGRAGYAVTTAADGSEGLCALRQTSHALLITDYHMPRYNGLELIQETRKSGILIPAILASGTLGELPPMDPLQIGCVAMLAKPFSAEELNSAVRVAMSSGRRRWLNSVCSRQPRPVGNHSEAFGEWEI